MTVKHRLNKLEGSTLATHLFTGARELLQARFDRADAATRKRLLRAIGERVEHRD